MAQLVGARDAEAQPDHLFLGADPTGLASHKAKKPISMECQTTLRAGLRAALRAALRAVGRAGLRAGLRAVLRAGFRAVALCAHRGTASGNTHLAVAEVH